MYKVMIIDDEPIIVEGLSRSVAWEKYDCQVVNTAHDGQHAGDGWSQYGGSAKI